MHVIVIPFTGTVLSVKRLSCGEIVAIPPAKNGYWRVVWYKKQKIPKAVTGKLTRKEAHAVADMLNALSLEQAKLLVRAMHSAATLIPNPYAARSKEERPLPFPYGE